MAAPAIADIDRARVSFIYGRQTDLIITRYLAREISKPFLPTLGILIVLFASFNVAAFLAQAANGLLPTTTIAVLVALKVVIALEVLIPIALYVSVFLALSRLHSDQEFVAMLALRVTPGRIAWAVFGLSACLAVAVGALSLVARPWAYQKLHEIADLDAVQVDVDAMSAGTFYESLHGDRVVFLTGRQGHGTPARDVFVRRRLHDHMEVIHAKIADLLPGAAGGEVRMSDAHIYEIGGADGKDDRGGGGRRRGDQPGRADQAEAGCECGGGKYPPYRRVQVGGRRG